MDKCENCGMEILAFEKRKSRADSPYVWWPEPFDEATKKYACSEECFRVVRLGCTPAEAKKACCPKCRESRGRCEEHEKS